MKHFIIPAILLLAVQIQACQSSSSKTDSTAIADSSYVDTTHNAQNSLDWAGTYQGVIPCADCPGITTTIELFDNDTFSYHAVYLETVNSVQDTGKFMWHENGSVVHLIGKDLNTKYKVAENKLIQLDTEGKVIEGQIADQYYLAKVR